MDFANASSSGSGAIEPAFDPFTGLLGGAILGGMRLVRGLVTNTVPKVFARVIAGDVAVSTLGRAGATDVFVTAADDIAGLPASQIGARLGIPAAQKYTVYTFNSRGLSVASPIRRLNPGFVGGGLTSGGAREFVIPNMSVPADATRIIIGR